MATSISTLSYRIVADTSQFSKGISGTRKELSANRRMLESMQTPLQKYKQSLTGINAIAKKFEWSADQKRTAINKLKSEFRETTTQTEKSRQSMGLMGGKLETWAAGMLTFGAATRVVGAAFAYMQAETDKAIASMENLEETRKTLRQVSEGGEDLQRLEKTSDDLAKEFGLSRADTQKLVFSARSEGFEAALPDVARFAGMFGSQDSAVAAAGQIPKLFPDSQITATQSLNAAFVAAKESRAAFGELIESLPRAAEGAGLAGATPSETMATLSTLASRFGSPKEASSRIRAFGSRASLDPALAGKGLIGSVEALIGMEEASRKEFLGENQELNVAFTVISQELAVIKQRQKLIDAALTTAGTSESPIAKAYEAALDPTTAGGRTAMLKLKADRAAVEREIANEGQLLDSGLGRKTAIDETMATIKRAGVSTFTQFGAEKFGETAAGIGLGRGQVRTATLGGAVAAKSLAQPGIGGVVGTPMAIARAGLDLYRKIATREEQDTAKNTAETVTLLREIADKDATIEEVSIQ